jgi:biopolymer transport protein ExbD
MVTTPTARRLILLACISGAPAFAQDKPLVAEAPKLAVSSQGKEKGLVDISVVLRHAAPAEGKCADAACAAADHWVVGVEIEGRTPAGKAVTLTMTEQKELEKELRTAATPKAKKVGETMISDATVSIRVPAQTPYELVHQLMTTAATAGLHKLEFAVTSAGSAAIERSLPLPLPVDGGAKPVLEQPNASLERVRVAMLMDQATGQPVRKWGKHVVPAGAEGDATMRTSFETIMGDMVKFGLEDRSVVLIDAASGVSWQTVIEVIDIGLNAGFKRVQFMTAATKK